MQDVLVSQFTNALQKQSVCICFRFHGFGKNPDCSYIRWEKWKIFGRTFKCGNDTYFMCIMQ